METKLPFTQSTAIRFDALYQFLNRKYQLESVQLKIAGEKYRIYKVADPDTVIDRVLDEVPDPDDQIPYWVELWPCALGLSHYISKKLELAGKTILELGSGLGLVGITAGRLGARVMMSDYLEEALQMSELNWMMNSQEPPEIYYLDWREPKIPRKYEIILASDVVYERRMFWPLLETFRTALAENGEIILSEPDRTMAKDFFDLLKKEGFRLKKSSQRISYRGKKMKISIYHIRFK